MKLLITADWHLRKDLPSCRNDLDWIGFQKKVIDFIIDKANEKNADICIVGDIFDKSKEDVEVINLFLNCINKSKNKIYTLAGNHDLLYHSSLDLDKTSFGIIWKHQNIKPLWNLGLAKHYGQNEFLGSCDKLIFLHAFIYIDKKQDIFNKGYNIYDLINQYPNTKWFFVGDNHRSFTFMKGGKVVINPGCITIQTMDMINYKPKIFIFDTENIEVEEILIPDFGQSFVDIEERKNFDKEIDSFIELIKDKKELSFDFISNLKNALIQIKDKELFDFLENFIKELL